MTVSRASSTNRFPAFNDPGPATRGLLNAIMSVGSIVALPITPYIADIAGRRAGIMTGCIVMIIGVILQSIGTNIDMFIAARFLIGFGVAIAHGSTPLLIAELVHPQHRAIFTTIYNSTWYLGSIIAAWLTYGSFSIAFKISMKLIFQEQIIYNRHGRGECRRWSKQFLQSSSLLQFGWYQNHLAICYPGDMTKRHLKSLRKLTHKAMSRMN